MKRAGDIFTNDTYSDDKDIFESRYYVYNKRSLCFCGMWPYQSFRERTIRVGVLMVFCVSLVTPQILQLIQSTDDIDAFIECFSPVMTSVGFVVKTVNLLFNRKRVRKLVDETRENWKNMRQCSADFKILQEYGEQGRFYTIGYMVLINVVLAAWLSMPLIGVIMDYIIPLNESRPHLAAFPSDYKIDSDRYFYHILLHATIACFAGIQMFVANDTLYMVISKHVCAMIDILRYRLENLIREDEEFNVTLTPQRKRHIDNIYYEEIINCMKRHKKILKYIALMESTCEWSLFFIIGVNVLVMSCTATRTVAKDVATQNMIRFAFFNLAQGVHLFCNTLPGHWILVSSSFIRDSIYNCRWYSLSSRSRKLIVIFLRRCLCPCTITAGKVYVMSMENFCSVLQTSMSYITMLTSME